MPRDLTDAQFTALTSDATRPIYLVEWEHAGYTEYLSCSGEIVYDGNTYQEGAIRVTNVVDSATATLTLPAHPDRVTEVQNGTWRGGACKIFHIPALPDDAPTFSVSDAILLINGEIRSSRFGGEAITVSVEHKNNLNKRSPRHTWNELTPHVPPPGTQISWEGDRLVLTLRDTSIGGYVTSGSTSGLAARGRLTAGQVKTLAQPPADRIDTVSASGAPIPIAYGRVAIPGMIFAIGDISGDLVLGVGWCWGELEEIEEVYINGETIPAAVVQTHYTGTPTQVADATLTAGIPAFDDPMIMVTPDETIGAAYSVFRIASGDLDSTPTFMAIVKGKKVFDPRNSSMAYSDNSALCMGDLATNPTYGMGLPVTGLDDAADWCDSLIEGTFKRCRLSLTLTQPRKTADYLDLLGDYAECIWFNEGTGITMKPDKAVGGDNPSGLDILENGDFDTDTIWTKGTGWSISGGVATCSGAQTGNSDLSQTVTVEDGCYYALYIDVATRTAGNLTVLWDSVSQMGTISAAGVKTAVVLASGTTADIDIRADLDFAGTIDLVKLNRLYYLEENCIRGSLSITGIDDGDTPSKVSMKYTTPSDSSPNWDETLTSISLPGVDEGEIPDVETTLNMQGVFVSAEANNKCNAKLQRMINRVEISWMTTDAGVRHRKGDAIEFRMPTRGASILVWVKSVEFTGYGRYRVTGLRYDPAHYPSELILPTGTGFVPVGAIVLLNGTTIPSGWAAYSDANGRYIVGAGGAYSVDDAGGTATHVGFSGNTTSVDSHGAGQTANFLRRQWIAGTQELGYVYDLQGPGDLTHSHTWATGTITPDPYRKETQLIQKTGSSETTFPKECMIFGLGNLSVPNLNRITDSINRLIKAASANADAGLASQFISVTTGSYNDQHDHESQSTIQLVDTDLLQAVYVDNSGLGGGSHTHNLNLQLDRGIKRKTLALYGGTDSYVVVPGMIVLWAGSLVSLPTDWALCDGTGATPDLRDYFIEIAPIGSEDIARGDNTITVSADSSYVGHDHDGDNPFLWQGYTLSIPHSNQIFHRHSASASGAWTPPYYALAAIMYSP